MTDTLAERFWSKVDKNGPVIRPELGQCWDWLGSIIDDKDYPKITIGYKLGVIRASHLSWIYAGFELPDDACVLHKCDNRRCVNPEHLFLGTKQTNTLDMYNKGRRFQDGENNGNHKLTGQQVLNILESVNGGISCAEVAKAYHVDRHTISRIKYGHRWQK